MWSIVFHSWLAFVFLLVANLLWIIPNQRRNMHRISPLVVIYAELLLIAQYLYCMNLTEDELPTTVKSKHYNLAQIGFVRYRTYPCFPLLLKTLFTVTFWLTLRQTKYEDSVRPDSSTASLGLKGVARKSKAASIFKLILTEVWIWIVVFALFSFAIFGETMTVFRILHMALFLTFMITFQVKTQPRIEKSLFVMFSIDFVTDILENLEENDVRILDCGHRFFDAVFGHDLYVSI